MNKLVRITPALLTLLFFSFAFSFHGVAQKEGPPTAQVNYISSPENGTMMVKVIGYGKKKEAAINQGEKTIFEVLMYRGLPGSPQTQPLIPFDKQSKVKQDHKKYLEEFFDGNYKTFIMSTNAVTELVKVPKIKYKKITLEVKVNYAALRKELEEQKLVRKFGF